MTPRRNSAGMDDRIRVAQFSALYRQGRISNLASPVIAAFVGFILLSEVGGGRIFTWLGFIVLATAARGIVHRRFERSLPTRRAVPESTKQAFLITICLSGLYQRQ